MQLIDLLRLVYRHRAAAIAAALTALAVLAAVLVVARKPAPPKPPAAAAVPRPKPPPPLPAITIAYRIGDYGALPFVIAADKGWWKAAGLRPKFITYPAEAPLLAAGAAGAWDVGATGGLAAVLGADRFGLKTIGIADDASDTEVVMAKPGEVDAIFEDPLALKGKTLWLTPDTSAEYAALACLAKWRLNPGEMTITAGKPAQIVAGFAGSKAALAALAAPEDYQLFAKGGAITVCSAKDGGAVIPEALVARKEFAAHQPQRVARFLAVTLRALHWEAAHRTAALAALRRFYEAGGLSLDPASLEKDFNSRPTFPLAEQLRLLDRSKDGESTADRWFGGLAAYLVTSGVIQAPPLGESFLTDRYMKWVEGDKMLKKMVAASATKQSGGKTKSGKNP